MLGAIIGDMAGSTYEFHSWQGEWQDIPLLAENSFYTDDTVLTIAVADALVEAAGNEETFRNALTNNFHAYARKYPKAGYGGRFAQWIRNRERAPYNSFGNGSAMRVSPVGWAFDNLADVEQYAMISASITHNHPEGIKGAQAVAGSIFLARTGVGKNDINNYVTERYGYDLNRTLAEIRPNYTFEEICQTSVPEAVIAFLESNNFEEAIKKAIWLRGDADTQAAIAGSIAEAYYGKIPEHLEQEALKRLDEYLYGRLLEWSAWLRNKGY